MPESRVMTINTSPADREPRVVASQDPAELLAEARLALRRTPRECLLLLGHDGHLSTPLITCSDIDNLLTPRRTEMLESHLNLLRSRGSTAAIAVFVLGDGYEEAGEPEILAVATEMGGHLLVTAEQLTPTPFPITPCWVLAGGTARQVVALAEAQGGWDLAVSPALPLRPFAETAGAAHAVLAGTSVDDAVEMPALVQAGARLRIPYPPAPGFDLAASFAQSRDLAARLASRSGVPMPPVSVTECEHIGAFFGALGSDALHWELLALCVERGQDGPVPRETLLETLTSDPAWRPHADVCAGGSWYLAIERLRCMAAAAIDAGLGSERTRAIGAWRGLTSVLVLLAWWNHRYASAGEYVDEIVRREPASTLAPLLSRLIDTPIPPAWWPDS